jgi:hypothetical protein
MTQKTFVKLVHLYLEHVDTSLICSNANYIESRNSISYYCIVACIVVAYCTLLI